MRLVLFGVFMIFACPAPCYSQAQTLSPEQLQEDLTVFAEGIRQYQPTLMVYGTEAAFDRTYDSLLAELTEPLSVIDFFPFLARLGATTREGHLQIGNAQDPHVTSLYSGDITILPFKVKVLRSRLYLDVDYTGKESLPRGSEILSINGLRAPELRRELHRYCSADGNILTYRDHMLSLNFQWWYAWFINQPPAYAIEYIPYGESSPKQITVPAITLEELLANAPEEDADEESEFAPFYTLESQEDHTVLTIKTYNWDSFKKQGLNTENFYKRLFREIKKSRNQHLIIDLRNNRGGRNGLASDILPHVVDRQFSGVAFRHREAWDRTFHTEYVPKPQGPRYRGEIYVLVNGNTFSSGSNVAKYLREFANATIIGEETGSRYGGYAAHHSTIIELPHSGYQIEIPDNWVSFPYSVRQTNTLTGLIPDVSITISPQDMVEGRDPAMEQALLIIRERNGQ